MLVFNTVPASYCYLELKASVFGEALGIGSRKVPRGVIANTRGFEE
jgi:hypothetical protein